MVTARRRSGQDAGRTKPVAKRSDPAPSSAMLAKPSPTIAPVLFQEKDFAGALDIRRWRAGERNTRLGASALHGSGSFAVRPISAGEAILVREPLSGNF